MRLDQMRLDLRRLPDLTTYAVTMSLCIVLKQRDDEQDPTVGHLDMIVHARDLHTWAFRHGQGPMLDCFNFPSSLPYLLLTLHLWQFHVPFLE